MRFENLSVSATLVASATATLGANMLLANLVGHGEVPTVQWDTENTIVTESGYDLTDYVPVSDGKGNTMCLRDYTVEREITTDTEDHEIPYLVPVPVPLKKRRNDTESGAATSGGETPADEYAGFADPVRAREIIEYVVDASSRRTTAGHDSTSQGGGRIGGLAGSRPYGGLSRETAGSDRWAKAALAGAAVTMLAAAPFAYKDFAPDSLICKDKGSWSMGFCGPNGEGGDQPAAAPKDSSEVPELTPEPSTEPPAGPISEETPPAAKGGTPGEGTPVPREYVDPCAGLPQYTDLKLIISQDGQHVSTEHHLIQP